jgi:hypothetical protein
VVKLFPGWALHKYTQLRGQRRLKYSLDSTCHIKGPLRKGSHFKEKFTHQALAMELDRYKDPLLIPKLSGSSDNITSP